MPQWIRPEKRWAIFARDGFACCYCWRDVAELHFTGDALTLDHRTVRRAWEGRDPATATRLRRRQHHPRNLLTTCFRCNNLRHTTNIEAWLATVFPQGLVRVWKTQQAARDREFHRGEAQQIGAALCRVRPRFVVENAWAVRRRFQARLSADAAGEGEPAPCEVVAAYRADVVRWLPAGERGRRQLTLPLQRPAFTTLVLSA